MNSVLSLSFDTFVNGLLESGAQIKLHQSDELENFHQISILDYTRNLYNRTSGQLLIEVIDPFDYYKYLRFVVQIDGFNSMWIIFPTIEECIETYKNVITRESIYMIKKVEYLNKNN